MPIPTAPLIPLYQPAPVTREALDYADLAIIDLRNFATTAEERGKLALQVREAMSSQGFFYVIGHGYSSEQMKRMFDIADVPFSRVSHDEKEKYLASTKQAGSFQGYKLRQYWHIDNGVLDQVETYNIHRDVSSRAHPEALRPLLPEIDQFARHSHINVLGPILRLMALGLELPEETLLDMHRWDGDSETYLRYMKYFPRSAEDEQKTKNVWLKGHNDIGTITLLYSQPVSALQILARDGTWKWVKHIDNAIVVNSGDAMDFLSGGLYRATIHRVVQPPPDQRQYTRLGIFYFCMADDDVKLAPLAASPVLQRLGIKRRFEKDEDAPVMAEWRKARTAAYGQSILSKSSEETDIEQEVIQGVVVKHYS
ncbi:Clavaminate synthase-like protein [Lentinula edodes]|uniref:Clavaminate synthase-like protein n=1 Tax=Lentinula edodes TaxID=5353 RepID=A0A1Q3DWZ7_LENED|nr:Clavaminate synthase-like protein [Lentinula edodes]KAH7869545.1 Clavaminate synthase-like protein [Lentinula edodes]KAJ3901141.1 Clavaminate synthase-like protein [Lentinula edodes]KAJ3915722.1 Clavaminate synthase-like protein [Lentinula edodes]GAV99527.1 Clavaminate synthase-like protein [Lentinula edodes]